MDGKSTLTPNTKRIILVLKLEIKMNKVAIIGSTGWVGQAMLKLFPKAYSYSSKIGKKDEVNKCEISFICVPTPFDGLKLDTSIVEDIIMWCKSDLIIVRSTVNPSDCDRWTKTYKKNIVMMPEYIGETVAHPLLDERARPFLIIGGNLENRKKVIGLMQSVYNADITIRQVTNYEAEIIKLTENRAIAFKVMQCQELYDICEKAGVDYYVIREAVYKDDPRFNLWWSFIYLERRGFNSSKCLKKDVPAFCAWAESINYTPTLTRALVTRSNEYELYQEVV